MEDPRNQISELHFGKFPDSARLPMLGGQFKDRSMRQLNMSNEDNVMDQRRGKRKISGLRSQLKGAFFSELDATMASALKRIISNQHFRRECVSKIRLLKITSVLFEEDRLLT